MWYHAITDFGEDTRYWWNRTREDLVNELVLPLVGKQIRAVSRRGKKALFNFGTISYMTIIRSKSKLKRPASGKVPPPSDCQPWRPKFERQRISRTE